jgi:hypothetical protein
MIISIPIAVLIVFGLFKAFIPHKERLLINEELLTKNRKKYARYEGLAIFPIFIFIGLISCIVFLVGSNLYTLLNNDLENNLTYGPENVAWFFPGVILAFGLMLIPMERFYQLLLKNEYELYLEFTNRKHGWDGMKIMKPVSKAFIVVGTIVFLSMLNSSLIITDTDLKYNDWLSVNSVSTKFTDIARIVHYDKVYAPNGNIVERDHHVLYNVKGEIIYDSDNMFICTDNSLIQFMLRETKIDLENIELREKK